MARVRENSFVWGSAIVGSWDNAANWNDTSGAGQSPAAVAPGSTDFVTINQAAGGVTNVITGVGDSASLTIAGATALQGQFTTGSLVLEDNASSLITLSSKSSLAVNGSVTGNDNSSIVVDGGQLTIGGEVTNVSYDDITIHGGTAAIAGNITNNYIYDSLYVTGGTTAITGNITNNYAWDYINVTGGTISIAGSITNTSSWDYANVTGGSLSVSGNVNNTGWADYFTVSGGAASIAGNLTNIGGYDNLYVSSGGTLTVGGTVANENSEYTSEPIAKR